MKGWEERVKCVEVLGVEEICNNER
jgi:hypothetical protein